MVKNNVKSNLCRFLVILILLTLLFPFCVSGQCEECDDSCNGDNCNGTQCLNDTKSCEDGGLSTWKPYVTNANISQPGKVESFNPLTNVSFGEGESVPASVNCDDGNSCTRDYYGQNGCVHDPVNCDNGTVDIANAPSSSDEGNASATQPRESGAHEEDIGYNEENVTRNESQSDRENVSVQIICDDADPCTTDSYDGAACIYKPGICDDGNESILDSCEAGTCINDTIIIYTENNSTSESLNQSFSTRHPPPDCDDNDSCTIDTFNGKECLHTLLDCSDDNATTFDYCYEGNCVHILTSCNDSNPCTTDSYNGTGCVHTSENCDDGKPCTADSCDPEEGCKHVSICDDGNPCTLDYCDGVWGCRHTPVACGQEKTCIDGFCLHPYAYHYAYPYIYPYTEPYNYNQPIKSYTIPVGTSIDLPWGAKVTALDTLKVENGIAYSGVTPLRFMIDLGQNPPVSGYQSNLLISDQAEMIGLSWQTSPFTVVLIQPDGSVLPLNGDNQNVLHLMGSSYDYYFLRSPARGNWNVEIKPTNPGTRGQGFSLITGFVRGAAPLQSA